MPLKEEEEQKNHAVMLVITQDRTKMYGASIDRIRETVRVKRFANDSDATAFFKKVEQIILKEAD